MSTDGIYAAFILLRLFTSHKAAKHIHYRVLPSSARTLKGIHKLHHLHYAANISEAAHTAHVWHALHIRHTSEAAAHSLGLLAVVLLYRLGYRKAQCIRYVGALSRGEERFHGGKILAPPFPGPAPPLSGLPS